MDVQSIRDFFAQHAGAVDVHMVDGTVYRVPHRDYIWFTPAGAPSASGPRRFASAFYLHDGSGTKLVNALLVHHLSAVSRGRTGRAGGAGGRRKSA